MKKAFTILELIFVLVVMGILSAILSPQIRSNKLREAAIQVVSHIRYTQHLAMVDDKFDANDDDWHKKRWQLIFGSSRYTKRKISYSIFSDNGSFDGNPNLGELALDPMSSDKFLSGGDSGILYTKDSRANKNMNIGLKYGIGSVTFTKGCAHSSVRRLTFDNFGRPIKGTINRYNSVFKANRLLKTTCKIVLTNSQGSVTIAIEPETGYAHIL
ncbi:MAG: type II secretion system protein [Sulfurimonas sp.]|nr:type II secretion system protein [Sulfurimonas sp.]